MLQVIIIAGILIGFAVAGLGIRLLFNRNEGVRGGCCSTGPSDPSNSCSSCSYCSGSCYRFSQEKPGA